MNIAPKLNSITDEFLIDNFSSLQSHRMMGNGSDYIELNVRKHLVKYLLKELQGLTIIEQDGLK